MVLEYVPRHIACTLMESFSTYRNCGRFDNPEDSSDTSGTSAEPMAVEAATPAEGVGPMSDPPLAEDPSHGFDQAFAGNDW